MIISAEKKDKKIAAVTMLKDIFKNTKANKAARKAQRKALKAEKKAK